MAVKFPEKTHAAASVPGAATVSFASYWGVLYLLSPAQAAANFYTLGGWGVNFIPPLVFAALLRFAARKGLLSATASVYLVFLLAIASEWLSFNALRFQSAIAYAAAAVFIVALLAAARQLLPGAGRAISAAAFLLVFPACIVPLALVTYSLSHRVPISPEAIHALLQTNAAEAYEYILDFIPGGYLLFFCLGAFTIVFLICRQRRRPVAPLTGKALLVPAAAAAAALLVASLTASAGFNVYNLIISGTIEYKRELALFEEAQRKRATTRQFFAEKENRRETYLVIIGESTNKKHMGVYGYLRGTTPYLSRMAGSGQLLVFDNAYSSHVHTDPALKLALTEANQYNGREFHSALSIVEVLKKAGVETYWLTNQPVYSRWAHLTSIVAKTADHLVMFNKTIGEAMTPKYYDGIFIDAVAEIARKPAEKNRVIFVQLAGTHGSYALRYPHSGFSIYKNPLKVGEFGAAANPESVVNFYDNSIVYNDFVVASLIAALERNTAGRAAAAIYVGDHADYAIKNLGHSIDWFDYEMTQIPMVAWFSEEYRRQYRSRYETLRGRTGALFSNDMLFNTLLGVMDVDTSAYDGRYDLSSESYSLAPADALVLSGERRYAESGNRIFWQRRNGRWLADTGQAKRIYPHRVNSAGKLKEIWQDGFRAFEVDALFRDGDARHFQAGHHEGAMGLPLSGLLARVDQRQIERIWLDFKNLSEANHEGALRHLGDLDRRSGYSLKGKMIVESGATGDFFARFAEAGWHTSYYLPTAAVLELLAAPDAPALAALAQRILAQVGRQQVAAVSFDHRLYPFVKRYLEPGLDKDIVYHTWYAPNLWDSQFQAALQSSPLYRDGRVKTLLTQYKSDFHL